MGSRSRPPAPTSAIECCSAASAGIPVDQSTCVEEVRFHRAQRHASETNFLDRLNRNLTNCGRPARNLNGVKGLAIQLAGGAADGPSSSVLATRKPTSL